MNKEKETGDIQIEYIIKKIEEDEAEENTERKIILVLEPVNKPTIPEQPMELFSNIINILGDDESIKKTQKHAEDMMKKAVRAESLFHVTVTPKQWKKLGKNIGDTAILTIQ